MTWGDWLVAVNMALNAGNIAEVGVLQPLIVRSGIVKAGAAPRYEIGAGHRRYRAAKLAELAVVPCLVREMTDQQFMEFLNIENLQREDEHPLDEATCRSWKMQSCPLMPLSIEGLPTNGSGIAWGRTPRRVRDL